MEGYIVLQRSLLDWEWFDDINTTHLWIYCLLKANFKSGKFKGKVIERGSFVSSYDKLSQATGLSIRQTRTAMDKLIMTNNMTKCTTAKYTIFTVCNYDLYQLKGKQNDKHLTNDLTSKATSNPQTNDKQMTTIELKKENKEYIYTPLTPLKGGEREGKKSNRFVPPTIEEIDEYIQEKGYTFDARDFWNFYESKNWMIGKNKMTKWKQACYTWESKRKKGQPQKVSDWYDDRDTTPVTDDLLEQALSVQAKRKGD